jgi:hypothetical protein
MNILTPILAEASANNAAIGAFAALGVVLILMILAVALLVVIGMWKVFTKAGQPGWAVLIPIYNVIVLLRVAGLPWYWVFALFLQIIPIIGQLAFMVLTVMCLHRISTRFGQGVGFTIGLTLLSPIFFLILGFGSSKYVGEQPAQA